MSKMRLLLSLVALALFSLSVEARHSYYPEDFRQLIQDRQAPSEEFRTRTFELLDEPHLKIQGQPDRLGCQHSDVRGECYRQTSLGYTQARKQLFGKIHLERRGSEYVIEDVYCQRIFGENDGVGPGRIPRNQILNTEHVWPQSKFTGRFSRGMQKADLHHLYPSDSNSNSSRGNFPFDEVAGGELPGCETAQVGRGENIRSQAFEPPSISKGNIARAMMYFSLRYQTRLDQREQEVLLKWHQLDPVDEAELRRNEMIYELQGNRNPFIDYPELMELVVL